MARRTLAAASAQVPDTATARSELLVESYRRLAEVFHHVLSEQSLDTLLDRIADTLAELMPYDALHVYEADLAQRVLVPVLARSEWAEEIMRDRAPFGEGITGWAAEHRSPVLANQAHLDPRVKIVPGTPGEPEALITVPLIARGALKGALNIYRIGEDAAFLDHEFELAKWFGDAAALALDNAQVRARLEHQAQTDSLTGLYNHRFFHERLRAELMRAHRTHDSVAVLMFDIDDFKKVNDIYGHGDGDQLLVALAKLARETVRGSDVVCRIGGEEFGVIMPSCDAGDATGLARRLNERLAETEFDPAVSITVSIGIAEGPEHATNPRELVACAEAAMMTAKSRGKNSVILYDGSTRERPASSGGRDVRSIAHLKLLQSLAGKLNRLNDVREIGHAIAAELRMLVDYHSCRVFVRQGDDLIPVAHIGDLETHDVPLAQTLAMKVGEGVTGRVAATGESMLVHDAVNCGDAVVLPGTEEIDESLAAVPLKFGTRVIGVLVISKLGLNQFDEDDVRLLEVLAGHASVAVENARLYEAQRREAETATALLEFADAIAQAPTQDAIAGETVEAAARLLVADQSCLWLLSDREPTFVCAAHWEVPDANPCAPVSLDEGSSFVAARMAPFLAHFAPGIDAPGSVAVAPLRQGDELRGWLAVVPAEQPTDDRLRLLAGLAEQACVALEKAQLLREQTTTAEIANALLEFSRALVGADGMHDVLERIVQLAAGALGSSRCSVWLENADGELRAVSQWGYPDDEAEALRRASYGKQVASTWLQAAEPYLVRPEDLADIDGVPESKRSLTFAVAPLRAEEGRSGCIALSVEDEADFDERKMRLLAGLAHQARLALESASNLEHLEETFVSTVEALANALEASDESTSTHARWIRDASVDVGVNLGLAPPALKRLELGALFHDIGKIGIPSEILRKPGPLTAEERVIVEQHPVLGERILAPLERLVDVRPIVRACHERWDGGGYPDGLAGAAIPIEARIIFVCDAFHAMTTDRPYRGRLPDEEAYRRLAAAAGTQFDPDAVEAFVRLHRAGSPSAAASRSAQ